jgi:DNA-binding GntR family transcriptional regulator
VTDDLGYSVQTKEELVARYIRDAIVAGRLGPGDRIRQQALAQELGMSPTPVREALRVLVTEGWLALIPHVGVSVAEHSSDGIEEAYRIREMLESQLAAEAACRITPAQMRQIRDLNTVFEQAFKANDAAAMREANFQFHRMIWAAANWPITDGILNALWARVPWAAMTGIRGRDSRTIKEHKKIIAALASGDPERAREVVRAHVLSGRADWEAATGGSSDAKTRALEPAVA